MSAQNRAGVPPQETGGTTAANDVAVAADRLHVHPQTVRYRMSQIRELFGERLQDPDEVLALLIALSAPR